MGGLIFRKVQDFSKIYQNSQKLVLDSFSLSKLD